MINVPTFERPNIYAAVFRIHDTEWIIAMSLNGLADLANQKYIGNTIQNIAQNNNVTYKVELLYRNELDLNISNEYQNIAFSITRNYLHPAQYTFFF